MNPHTEERLREDAGFHALGLLEGADLHAFRERLRSGDAWASAALGQEEHMAALLAHSLAPVAPPPSLRNRLMRRAASEHAPGLGSVRAHEGQWKETGMPGITYKKLYFDRSAGLLTTLLRMAPGARFTAHLHSKDEQCLILEGDLRHDDHVYEAGDFTYAKAQSMDPDLYTVNGNLLLIVSAPGDEFVPA